MMKKHRFTIAAAALAVLAVLFSACGIKGQGGSGKYGFDEEGEPIVFPLLPEINAALNDYVDNGRPISNSHYIFLNSPHPQTTPLKPHTVYTIVSRIINRSGIDAAGRRLGAHALRSSLASQLLDEGNSYSVIQKVLGHTSPEAAKAYVRIETEKLRECALPLPEIKSESLLNFLGKAGDDV